MRTSETVSRVMEFKAPGERSGRKGMGVGGSQGEAERLMPQVLHTWVRILAIIS